MPIARTYTFDNRNLLSPLRVLRIDFKEKFANLSEVLNFGKFLRMKIMLETKG